MSRRIIILLTFFCCVLCLEGLTQTPGRKGPIIRQADHILVESEDPGILFSFFVDTLKLPIAWPITDNAGFVSGGVGIGNVNLEIFRYEAKRKAVRNPSAHFAGLAFEPYPLSNALRELKTSGIPHNPPEAVKGTLPKNKQGILYTTVALSSLSRPGLSIFLYEYSPEYLNVVIRRKLINNRITLNQGGPLGFQSTAEIVIATSSIDKDRTVWTELLGAITPSGNWRAGDGPAIRIIAGKEDGIREIVLKVKSPDDARSFLKKNNLLGAGTSGELLLNPAKVQGLRIRISDSAAISSTIGK
jgi:hypothetical protein